MLHGTKCLAIKKQHTYKISLTKIRILRWINVSTRKDKIQS